MGKRSGLDVSARQEAVLGVLRRAEQGAVLARRYGFRSRHCIAGGMSSLPAASRPEG